MKTRKRLVLVALLALSAFAGNRLAMAWAARFRHADLSPRPIARRSESRLGMRLAQANIGGPGSLVVSGVLEVGLPDSFPNRMDVVVWVTAPDGTVLVNEIVGHCDVAKDVQQTEYPVLRTYKLPPGLYYVQLVGFDHPGHTGPDGVTIVPNCGTGAYYFVG